MPYQTKIIESTNAFLSNQDSSAQLNEGGVCGGLASLYVQYALQGKDKKREFFQLSKKLAKLPANYSLGQDSDLAKFIVKIETEFNRFIYSKGQYYQGDMDSSVLIDGKPIQKEYSLGLVKSPAQWATIMEKLYNEERACYVRSHNHAVALSFVDGEYELYDPNYDEDSDNALNPIENNVKRFKNANDVIAELSRQFGYPDKNNVGLGIIIYAHPNEKRPAIYPDKNQLLTENLKTQQDYEQKVAIKDEKWDYNSLFFATVIDDKTTVNYHVQNKHISILDCAYLMQMDSNNETVFNVYAQNTIQSDKQVLIYYSIWAGNTKLFKQMTNDYQNLYVKTEQQREEFKQLIQNSFSLERAAESTNPICLLQILELYEKYGISFNTIKESQLIKIINDLTKHGDVTLLNSLSSKLTMSKEAVFGGIRTAAKHDKHDALRFWLNLSTKLVNGIDSTLINEELLSTCSLLNFQQITQTGFTVRPALFREALKRNRKEFIEESMKGNPNSRWVDFYTKLTTNKLESPIDLCSEHEGLNALEFLISYKANDLIKNNWSKQVNVTPEIGTKALAFACECGNQKMVEFLTTKEFKVPTSFQINHLKKTIKSSERNKIDALLATHIDYQLFFNKSNIKQIEELIYLGKSQFIINAWKNYKKEHPDKKELGPDIISIDGLLWSALTQNNKDLYEFIAKSEPETANQLLKSLIDNQNPALYVYAINLAQAFDPKQLHQFIASELSDYERVLFERTTQDDEVADKKFRTKTREMIEPLISLLIYAIEHQYFAFAERINSQVNLSLNELLDLFIKANQTKNKEITNFIMTNYRQLSSDKNTYLTLAETNQFDLLATFLENNKEPLDNATYITLLKKAARVPHERTIQLLAPYINTAYKIEGTALYEAINEENVKGCILLLTYQGKDGEIPLPDKLLLTAIQQNDNTLLHAAFQKPKFVAFFKNEFIKNLEDMFKYGSPEATLYIYNKLNKNEFFTEFLNHAIASDDVVLLKKLQKNDQFAALDRKQLFNQACEMKAPKIANELLSVPMEFTNKEELHAQLDKLFNVDKESNINAHDIYNLIYKQALHRLYEFVKFYRYRPFSALHESISSVIDDPGLPQDSPLKNYLFQRALDEGDQQKLDALLNQLKEFPSLNKESIELFSANLNKSPVITVLLRHYPLHEVLEKAMEFESWQTVAALLHGRSKDEINPLLIEKLQKHDLQILNAIEEHAKTHLTDDPRIALNNLLIEKNNLALSAILINKKAQVEDVIMKLQQLMRDQNINLKSHVYRFDLYHQLLQTKQVFEKVDLFFEQNKDITSQVIAQNEAIRHELRELKQTLETNNLVPAHFEQREQLESVFDALIAFDKTENKYVSLQTVTQSQDMHHKLSEIKQSSETSNKEHPTQPSFNQQETDAKQADINPLEGLINIVDRYRVERKAEDHTHHWISIVQYTKEDKLEAAQNFIRSLQSTYYLIDDKDRDALNNGRLHTRIHEYLQANQKAIQEHFNKQKPIKTVDQLIDTINQHAPIDKLIYLLTCYYQDRAKQPETYHFGIFPQYTKSDKLNAVGGLIETLQGKSSNLSDKQKGALKQGSLGILITEFMDKFNAPLKHALNTKKMNNLDDLIRACGQHTIPTKGAH